MARAQQSRACLELSRTFDRLRRLARTLDLIDPRAGDQVRVDARASLERVIAERTGTGTRASGGAR